MPRQSLPAVVAALSLAVAGVFGPAVIAQTGRDGEPDWQQYLGENAKRPASAELPALLTKLSTLLASPDAKLRDDIGYTLLAKWIYRDRITTVEQRNGLLGLWSENLTRGIGKQNDDSVLLRSFSALTLSILALLDNNDPWLSKQQFDTLLTAAITYLRDERDVRGYDRKLGWLHSAAHTADLLKFLARNRHLTPQQQQLILSAIADKIGRNETTFAAGEDERLARAVLSLTARDDFVGDAFATWLDGLVTRQYQGQPAATLAKGQNRRLLLVSLFALLSVDDRKRPGIGTARTAVLKALGGGR